MGKKDPLVVLFEGVPMQRAQMAVVLFSMLVLAMEDSTRGVAFQPMGVYVCTAILGVIFLIELVLKFKAYGGPKAYVDSFWRANEVAIVVVFLLQFILMFRTPTTPTDDDPDSKPRGAGFEAPLGVLKVLDCLQALRAIRFIGMVPAFRDIVSLLVACRDEMLSNLVMVILICSFFSVVMNALFRGKMDFRCCTVADIASGLCNGTAGDLGPGSELPLCGGGYMCEDATDYDVVLGNYSTYDNKTNITSWTYDYGIATCTEVDGGPNDGLFEFNSVSHAGYNVFTASMLTGVEKKIWWTMDGAYFNSIWIYMGMLIVNHLILLNLFFGAIVLGYRAEKKARRMALEGSKNPELTDALDLLNTIEALDDKELTEMFRGKEDTSKGPVKQVFDEKPPPPTTHEALMWQFNHQVSPWNITVNLLIVINFIILLSNPPGPVNSFSTNLIGVNFAFNLLFLLEATFRLVLMGPEEYFKGKDGRWNTFDLFVGLATTIDSIMQLANYQLTSSQGIHAVRLVRMMKLMRLIRATKVWNHGDHSSLPHVGLRDLMALLNKTGKYLGFTFFLSWVLIYIFAIVGMRVFGGELYLDDRMDKTTALNDRAAFNFDTFPMAFYSCWFVVNLLNTDIIMDDVVHNGFTWFAFFVAMIFIVRCYVLSLIMAVLFDAQKDRAIECNCAHAKEMMISTYKLEFYLTKYVQFYFFKKWQKFCGASVALGKPKVADEPPPPPTFMQRFMEGPETMMLFQEKDWQRLAALGLTSPKSKIRKVFEVFMFVLVSFSVWVLTLGEERPKSNMLRSMGMPTSLTWWFDVGVAILLVAETLIRSVAYGFFPFKEGAVLRRPVWACDAIIALTASTGLIEDVPGFEFLHTLEFLRLLRIARFITPVKNIFSDKIIVSLLDGLAHSAKTATTIFLFVSFWLFMFVAFGVEMFAGRMNYCTGADAQAPWLDNLEGVSKAQCNFMSTYVINRTTICQANLTAIYPEERDEISKYAQLDGFRGTEIGGEKYGYPVYPTRDGPYIGFKPEALYNENGTCFNNTNPNKEACFALCYNSTYPEDLGYSEDACVMWENDKDTPAGRCAAWQPFAGLKWFSPDMNFDTFSEGMVTLIRTFSFASIGGVFFNVVDSKHWDSDGDGRSFVREQYPEGGFFFVLWGTMHYLAIYIFIAGFYGVFYGTVLLPKGDGVVPSRKQASWETYATQLRWITPLSFPSPPENKLKLLFYNMVRSKGWRIAHSFIVALSFSTYYFYGSYGWHKGWDLWEEKFPGFWHFETILTFIILGEQVFRFLVYGIEDSLRSKDQQLSIFCNACLALNFVANTLFKENGLEYGESMLTLLAYVAGGMRIFLIVPNSHKLMSATNLVARSFYFMLPIAMCLVFVTFLFSCVGMIAFKDTMGKDWTLQEELHGRESGEVIELRERHFRNAFQTLGSTMQVLFLSTISDSMDSLFMNVDATLPRGAIKWYVAPLFFGLYCILVKFCTLAIAKFIIVHVHEEGSIDLPDICMEQVNDFKEQWHELDEYGTGVIKLQELSDFLATVKEPLGLKDDSGAISPKFMNDRYALRVLRVMYPHLKSDADAMAAAQER
eukprot:CAMPEP_0119493106 /NCGR_PEP_ID=MMETSP1344-20130328/17448_1 /TAXON_ID=236787 /ORGANISM="Florenciella parvula, Strain CCMP2471" /LENGTH=1576 /DNA_ID=CAMNT_0007528501 /DNA_START=279 /DNA_END=5006 /DNA_ORIENTATION=+